MKKIFPNLLGLGFAGLLLLCGGRTWALPDTLSITVTNTWTKLPVAFNLQRYNLRATNYQVRIYSDATNYTLLPTNQIPEVTTYRGRITGDPGAVVVGAFDVNGLFYYNVSYGCRWQASTNNSDPYDTTNRLSWGGWTSGDVAVRVATTNLPGLGYFTNYAVAPTNLPQHITWATNNYPANPAVSYGGPPYLNVLKQVPVQRVRVLLDSDNYRFFSNVAGSNINTAILMQESRINDVDYEQARDLGICYQITGVCVRTNTQLPYTTTTGNLGEENAFWNPDLGYSHGVATNGWFDMVHGSVNVADAGGWAYAPGDFSVMNPNWCGFASGHEMGHNWGQSHYDSVRDYTGDNYWHIAMTGSGFDYSTWDANTAQNLRRSGSKSGYEWVKYNYQVPPHATPDLATTKTNQSVSLNVLLNDYIANSNTLSIGSFETNTAAGGAVTNLGSGVLQYKPANNFVGYDLFHYYVGEPSGLKSLTAAKVLVTSDANPLLGEWPLNETTGTIAAETTGSGPAATLYGTASFTSGSVPGIGGGNALHLDGSGYARFKGTWFDSFNTNVSISLWVRPDATPTGEQMLFMKSSLDANNSPGVRLGMTGSTFFFSACTVGGQSQSSVKAAVVPQAGVWYHVVGEIDRTSGLIRLFVNGVEYTGTSSTRTIPAGEFIAGDNWPALGVANDGGGNKSWLVGAIDDVRLYTKALSLVEIQSIYLGAGVLPAAGPHPIDGEGNVVFLPTLTWQPGGTNNFQYNVYLGTNAALVTAATTNSAQFMGLVASSRFIVTNTLATNVTYFWRVDELYGTNVASSDVWAFTTAVDAIHGGLKLYLSLDSRDTSGTTTYDRSGAPFHDGTLLNSPIGAAGQVNEALSFNGSNSSVETPALGMATSNATFLAWLYQTNTQGGYTGVIMCNGGSTWSGMMISSSGTRLGYQWNDDSATWSYNSGPVLPTNQWVLAAVSVTNSVATFYLGQTNGVITSTTLSHAHIFQAFDGPLDVGRDSSGWGRYFKGLIDEACVWNRALSAAEIGQILTNGINGGSFAGVPAAPDPNTFTWVGDTDAYWTNGLNWATNATPGAANTVYFNDAARLTGTQLGTNLSVAGVNISGGLRSVGIYGTNTLALGAGGILMTNVTASLALGTAVSLGAAQTWTVPDNCTLTLTNKLSGTGNPRLTLDGGGTFNLNNNGSGSSYAGNVVVNGGTLSLPFGWYTASVTGNVSVGTNGTVIFNTHPYGGYLDNYTTNAGLILVNGDNACANLELRGGQIIGTGDLRVGDGWGSSSGGKWASRSNSVTASINLAFLSLYNTNTTFTVENGTADPDLLVSAPMKDGANGAASFTKTGLGSLTLTQPNAYTGSTTNSQGTLNLDGTDNILPVSTSLYLAANTTVNLLNGINQAVASLTGFGTINLGSGSLAVTLAGTNTFGGILTGNPNGASGNDTELAPPGGFALAGTGKLTLTNIQAHVGDTWVSSGTLALSGVGSLAASAHLVVSGGATLDATARTDGTLRLVAGQTLSGFGAVAGKVAATNGAAIAPGVDGVGSLIFNNTVNLIGGQAQLKISKTGATPANSSLTGITTLTCGGTLVVTNLGPDALTAGDTFKLFYATTYAGAFTNFNLPTLATNLAWDTSKVAVNGNLAVFAPVVITNQPSGVVTNAGNPVSFTVGADGSPTLGYQWRFNGTNLAGGTLPTLTLTNVSAANTGNYTVVVTNFASSVTSSVAVLTVNVPVTITNSPASVTVYVNSNAVFNVGSGGTPAPAFQWQFNGTNLVGATVASYSVTGAQPTNEGNYTVIVTNVTGSVTSAPAGLSLYREFSRAPLPYPSLLASNGARHLIVPGFQLGATNVATTDARTNAAGEDGVTFITASQAGQVTTVRVVASASGYLNAWLDGNTNGSWADAGDQIITNFALAGGTNTLNFTVPANASATAGTWARFRFSSATNLTAVGEAPDGEVEDYLIAISGLSLAYTAGTNGSLGGVTLQTVSYNASGSPVSAVPDAGYHFVIWSDGSTANPRTDLNVTNSLAVTAGFAINTYTLNYVAGANGNLTGSTNQTVNYGANGTAVTAVPNSGYAFTNWSDGLTANPRTDLNVTSNLSATANFVALALVPPVITGSPAFGGGGFSLTFNGPAGQTYKILTSTNLVLPVANWSILTNGTFIGSPVTVTNVVLPGSRAGYFRLTSP